MDFSPIQTALERRGFACKCFATAAEAKAYLLEALRPCPRVGIGGSMTVKDMSLSDALREQGNTVLWHWEAEPDRHDEVLRQAMTADAYLCSANALLADGRIVQIDGTGNRVAALCYGPAKVFLAVGRNKLVPSGGLLSAVARIRKQACPQNARRLHFDTPCATGACDEERCGRKMCHLMLSLEAPPNGRQVEVLLIDEELGY